MTGGDLAAGLKSAPNHRFSSDRALHIGSDVLEALTAAHMAGVIHRDVAPNNIWLDANGRAVVGDFGIAAGGVAGRSSELGIAIGKMPYMAPEVLLWQPAGAQSDLYSLGCTLYELITGRPPFVGTPDEIARQHINAAVIPPSTLVVGVRPPVEAAILALLEKKPENRPTNAQDARNRLLAALTPARPATPPSQRITAPSASPPAAMTPIAPSQRQTRAQAVPAKPRRNLLKVSTGIAALVVAILVALGFVAAQQDTRSDSSGVAVSSGSRTPSVSNLKVLNSVFEGKEQNFEARDNVVACFDYAPGTERRPLDLIVLRSGQTPMPAGDARAVARATVGSDSAGTVCQPVEITNTGRALPAGEFVLWALRGSDQLATKQFTTITPTVAAAPAAAPTVRPTPPPTSSPTPRPAWLLVRGLPPDPWQCVAVRERPAVGTVFNCLPNGTIIGVTGEPQTANGARWWLTNAGGWVVDTYVTPSDTGPPAQGFQTGIDVVRQYYALLKDRRWPAAYQLLSPDLQASQPYGVWAKNFDNNEGVEVLSVGYV